MSLGRSAVELSDRVVEAVKKGQEAALEAVHKFADTLDEALLPPAEGEQVSKHREVIDSAFEMAERLVATQYEFVQHVVRAAAEAFKHEEAKPPPETTEPPG